MPTTPTNPMPYRPWQPQGTVYGTLLNFRREWDLCAPRMTQDPHKAAPQAPILYVKSANTFSPAGQDLLLQDGVTEVDIGASLGLVIGGDGQVAGAALLCDWSVPHASYYRPPVKFRCRDGFLALPQQVTQGQVADWAALQIVVRRNGERVQTLDLRELIRDLPTLLIDVGEFMTLQPGDVLMVGTDGLADGARPRAKAGDRVEISASGFSPVSVQVGGAA
ncbi:fumarylacetoacetate hydrolase family protein [Limnohabitans sp. Rim8]|uniref:fumarylacetoacetate hydrolase family protein n=1 Tax=Limnohabitans sp. Rim8 TaxID=1100718 RepID=UPI0026114D22|nr:fumarylacetoacetate hydrolase family protein [Limnohabitans sp. Rim8]